MVQDTVSTDKLEKPFSIEDRYHAHRIYFVAAAGFSHAMPHASMH